MARMSAALREKRWFLVFGIAITVAGPFNVQAAGLMIDFGSGTLAAGWQSYAAANAAPDPAAVVYSSLSTGFASDVTVDVDAVLNGSVLTSNTPANAFRVVNRTPGLENGTAQPDLLRDWLAVTQLASQPETILRVTVTGLAPGEYQWTSWHHDLNDQTGLMDMTMTVGGSSVTSQTVIDVSNGATATANGNNNPYLGVSTPTNDPTMFAQTFTVTAGQALVFELSPQSPINTPSTAPSQFASVNFTVMNGFQIQAIPEPSVGILGLLAAGLLAGRRHRPS